MTLSLRLREWVVPVVLMVASTIGVSSVREKLVTTVTKVRETSAVYPLPPAEQLPLFSLGYRSAMADLIWSSVMVNQGLAIKQKHRFFHASHYFDAIFALEPTYRQPYLLVEAILTFGAFKATAQDAFDARRLLEQGMHERPFDAQLFIQAGAFMAYLAPSLLPESEQMAWRRQGALLIARAGEMGAADNNLQWQALGSSTLLTRVGERQAAIDFLRRVYGTTDDAELRTSIYRQLRNLEGEDAAERAFSSVRKFEERWREEFPFISRTKMLLLGPNRNWAACAGSGHSSQPECADDWKQWSDLVRQP